MLEKIKEPINLIWMRRDLRLEDNTALIAALKSNHPVLCIFIFDKDILDKLDDKKDRRVQFIYEQLKKIHEQLSNLGSSLLVLHNHALNAWQQLFENYNIENVFYNTDYEPHAITRDQKIEAFLQSKNCGFHGYKDLVIFEKNEISKPDGNPYTVYTPYKNKWIARFKESPVLVQKLEPFVSNFLKIKIPFSTTMESIGFENLDIAFPSVQYDVSKFHEYKTNRDFPSIPATSLLSVHLRFGTVSTRQLVNDFANVNESFLSELIWREFFQMIFFNFPNNAKQAFKPVYEKIKWENNTEHFEKWCKGKTGVPIVDAGMRELLNTGLMHNRVRMIVANYLTKILLIDWKWGEAFFAKHLLDFEWASNNGNWQWSAGCGCDAAPYFRIFSPQMQQEKFDAENKYINKWIPELNTNLYPQPIVDYSFGRKRALERYKQGLSNENLA